MDIDYKKPVNELVVDLINRDNPQLPFPIKYDECFFGTPTAWSGAGDYRNTEVSVTPRPNSPYIGGFKVRYRRLRMQSLFPEGVWFDDWYVNGAIPIADYLTALNRRTGLQLKATDTTAAATIGVYLGPAQTSTLSMAANNLAFSGAITNRFAGKYPVSFHVPADANVLVHWDGVPRDETDPLRRYTIYGHDFSAWVDYLETWGTTAKTLTPTDPDLISLVQYLADITGQPFNLSYSGDSWDLGGAFGLRAVNPTSTPLGVNNVDYNRVVSIYRAAKTGNIPDQLFLHYKV
jgi:hypothetical protein